jgi:hypothetical protein
MTTVLILNHKIFACGVYQFGRRVYELVSDSKNINYFYREVDSLQELGQIKQQLRPDYIIYNWHRGTMPWLLEDIMANDTRTKHLFIYHEEFIRKNYSAYLFFGDYGISKAVPRVLSHLLPRPLLNYTGEYPQNTNLTIGSFGFAFKQKGFERLVNLVNKTLDNVTLNLHLTQSFFADPLGYQFRNVISECRRLNINKKVNLNITSNFLDDDGVLSFLAGNDINVFMYNENGEGLSSVIDYALSVKRPIAITNCQMFRHILKDDILIEKNSIQDILNKGISPLEEFYSKWSIDNFIKKMEEVINE